MMNLNLQQLSFTLRLLLQEEKRAGDKKLQPPERTGKPGDRLVGLLSLAESGMYPHRLSDDEKGIARQVLDLVDELCQVLELHDAMHRSKSLAAKLDYITLGDYEIELRVLGESFEFGLRNHHCYYYPADKARMYLSLKEDWKLPLEKFPSAARDILHAVDCYATGHNTACVFHLMRIVEHGLRALARDRRIVLRGRKPIVSANWQEVISAVESHVRQVQNARAGAARAKALEFYQGILGEFSAFKDVYRNEVMHTRADFDQRQAFNVLMHVRGFMTRVSDRLGEAPRRTRK